MSPKSLNAIRTHKILSKKITNNKIKNLYRVFDKKLDISSNFAVAVSGGPDSLALAYLSKIYSIKKKLKIKYLIVDHKLRKNSTNEAKNIKRILKNMGAEPEILSWNGKKPKTNIQAMARKKRYELLNNFCKKNKINNLLLGHHSDDLYENFFIRLVRGSGLKGLTSLSNKNQINGINLIRPLLDFNKSDLIYISKYVFNFYVLDPSNKDTSYTRVRVRNFIENLKGEGFDKAKLALTINNLKRSNETLEFYVRKNKKFNSYLNKKKREIILSEKFFKQPYEVIFRSLALCIKEIGGKYNIVRGKKIDNILVKIAKNTLFKETLGGCIIKKLNQTVIISKEY